MATNSAPQSNTAKAAKKTMKHWMAVTMFAAIIIVFVLWGVRSDRYGDGGGVGVAAVVNDTPISYAEFRGAVENMERNMGLKIEQLPEAQRRAFQQQVRARTMEQLILGEVMYQAANKRGVVATDAEVRDYISQIPIFQENGRFMKDRYKFYLENTGQNPKDFERQLRKQIVQQRLQELFLGSAAPSRSEVQYNQELSRQKVQLKFVEIRDEDLKKPGFVSDADVADYLKKNKDEVEGYYKGNPIEFTHPEKIRARHILLKTDDKHSEADVLKKAEELRKQATPENFAKLASQYSEDPGSKGKGGDLGEFERGRMIAEFENAAFALKPGQISGPVKSEFGVHLIYLEKKTPASVQPLAEVQNDLARKLLVNRKSGEILAKVKDTLGKGGKKDLDALVSKAGLKWQDSGEFNLAAASVPKLNDSQAVIETVMKRGKSTGLVPDLIQVKGGHVIVDVTSWKDAPPSADKAGANAERMMAYRNSSDLIEAWAKDAEAKAEIQRNTRALQ